ncbi:MAG: response regulator transcription factor [Acutalibacteraceae bacterium]
MKHILIIEDDTSIAELERDYLEANEITSEIVPNGELGLQKALHQDYDLILLDVMLPGMDGFSICRTVREQKNIPILLVSARREDIDKIRGLGLGADDYISKPFSPSELVARVKAHINRYERLTTSGASIMVSIYSGRLRVHLDSRRVLRKQKEIILANKEFDLLAFLIENPDVVFSKETLFDRIWGMEPMGETSTVTVHINRIREKIEPDPSNPRYIETIWGVGYRFRREI